MSDIVEEALGAAKGQLIAGEFGAVLEICGKILQLDPEQGLAYRLMQEACVRRGASDEALEVAVAHVEARASDAGAWFGLGDIRLRLGLLGDAEAAYRQGLSLEPGHIGATTNLAVVKLKLGALGDALAMTSELVERDPSSVGAWHVLGATALSLSDFQRAVEAHEKLVALAPDGVNGWVGLGLARKNLGDLSGAQEAFDRVLALEPGHGGALFGRYLALPIIHETEAATEEARAGFAEGLEKVRSELDLETPAGRAGALEACLSTTNFFLHYQGYDDLSLQRIHGALLQTIVGASFPSHTLPKTPRSVTGRIKIGFISANFHWHSIFKTHGGFITQLNRQAFEITTIHLGAKVDDATRALQSASDHFLHWPDFNPKLVDTIEAMALDVIVYPDLGMEPLTQSLATLRLAPVQCNAGGHPITSGLDTIDYFLSSDLMEAEGAQAHYSEQLVRLPQLFTAYPRPEVVEPELPDLLRDRSPTARLVCLQSLYKLLPQFDWVYAELLERLPGSELCFIAEASEPVTDVFRRRVAQACQARGLSFDERVIVLPRMSQGAFYGLASSATVVLDSFLWSGNNSSMEASWLGRPIVTWPGPMMRGRHTYAILKRMGLEALIANDLRDYVERVVRLVEDEAWRAELERVIAERKDALFDDLEPIRGFEAFLLGLWGLNS